MTRQGPYGLIVVVLGVIVRLLRMYRGALLVGISARVDIGVDVKWCENSIVRWCKPGKRLVLTRRAAFFRSVEQAT